MKRAAKSLIFFIFCVLGIYIGIQTLDKSALANIINDIETRLSIPEPAPEIPVTYGENTEDSLAKFTVIDVGQGSALLMQSDGECLLYDGGDNDASSVTVTVLKKAGVSRIRYIIASHYDSDHIGGIIAALKNFEVDTLLLPTYEPEESRTYLSLQETIKESGVNVVYPEPGEVYACGKAKIRIIGPLQSYEDENANSIASIIETAGKKVYVGGDATAEAEEDMAKQFDVDVDVMLIDHHGSSTSSSMAFMREATPMFSIISCGKNNDYHHPTGKVLTTVKKYTEGLYRTDIQGDIVFHVTKTGLCFEQEPCNDYTPQ